MMINELGLRLKLERVRCNLKQKDVAKLLNIDATSISAYETGNATPPAEVLMKIASIYNVTTDYLLGIERKSIVLTDGLNEDQVNVLRIIARQFMNDNEVNKSMLDK